MAKKLWYLTLDTETATLPFADEIATTPNQKKTIAIAKPLVYDIGWVIHGRLGDVRTTRQFLVAETFAVPSVFNTAYYKEKRPIYIQMLKNNETTIKPWQQITEILIKDMGTVDFVCAYNARFDFKKAIPFTDLYISRLYSNQYFEWEKLQRDHAERLLIVKREKKEEREPIEKKRVFQFKGKDYPMIDIWGQACRTVINNYNYKRLCIENGMISDSGEFFKTSAETSYRYLVKKMGFEEAHTALADAIIEVFILSKIAKRGRIQEGIIDFPFKLLGKTNDFLIAHKKRLRRHHFENVLFAMDKRVGENDLTRYEKGLLNRMLALVDEMEGVRE